MPLPEIDINNNKGYVVLLYRSSSQTPNEFDCFINNLEKLISSGKRDYLRQQQKRIGKKIL